MRTRAGCLPVRARPSTPTTDGGNRWVLVKQFVGEQTTGGLSFVSPTVGFVITARHSADGKSGYSTMWKTTDCGAVAAVVDVSLVVRQGEIFGFLGPNGAGKTTTISMCSTLDERPCTECCLNQLAPFPHSAIDVGNSTAPRPLQRAPDGSRSDLARACLATRYGPTSAELVSRL